MCISKSSEPPKIHIRVGSCAAGRSDVSEVRGAQNRARANPHMNFRWFGKNISRYVYLSGRNMFTSLVEWLERWTLTLEVLFGPCIEMRQVSKSKKSVKVFLSDPFR